MTTRWLEGAGGLRPAGPTVLLPIGAAAARVIDQLGVRRASQPLIEVIEDPATSLEPALQRLLRAGTHTVPRLDVVVVVDALQGLPEPVLPMLRSVTSTLEGRYSAIFTPVSSPDQRSHGVHLVVLAPALVRQGPAQAMLAGIGSMLADPAAAHVSRVWLLAAQTAAGVLTETDQVAAAAAFIGALFGEGLRDSEAARLRLAPTEQKLAMAAAARLDLPMATLATWVQVRSAWEALDVLVQRTHAAPRGAVGLPDGLDASRLVEPLVTGAAAQRLRQAATGTPEHQAALEDLHRAEIVAFATANAAAEALLRGDLTARHRLDLMPDLLAALGVVVERQQAAIGEEDAAQAPLTPTHTSKPAPETSLATPTPRPAPLPTALLLAPIAAATGLATGAWLGLPAAASTAMLSSTVVTTAAPSTGPGLGLPMAVGALLGALVGLAATWWLTRPPPTVVSPTVDETPGRPDVTPTLALARARVRRSLVQVVRHTTERLETARAALREARDALRGELSALRARPGERPELDDLEPLLGPEAPLHAHLLSPGDVARWLARSRRYAEPEVWADQLLAALWPKTGLLEDAPAADLPAAREAGKLQLVNFDEHTLFDDEQTSAVITSRFAGFLQRATQALAPATVPRGPHGDPTQGIRPGEILVLAPDIARPLLEEATRRAEVALATVAWSPDPSPRVVLLRTWEGFSVEEIARGAGLGVQP